MWITFLFSVSYPQNVNKYVDKCGNKYSGMVNFLILCIFDHAISNVISNCVRKLILIKSAA